MNGYDGPTLRSVRESREVPLRRVARLAGMSHGHLSKVERGEHGRPVTPAVLAAYEKATGVRLMAVAGHAAVGAGQEGWRRGHLSELRRRTFNAKVAAVAVGGPLGEHIGRTLAATGRSVPPDRIDVPDVVQVEQVGRLCTGLDLRFGGGVSHQLAKALLRWAVGLLESRVPEQLGPRLHAAVGALAQRAGWAAFDADAHDTARSLFTVALYAATQADDPDLRAHVLADVASQHNYLGYPDDCLQVVRFGEVDERVGPTVRMVVNGVKARACAVRGDAEACRRHIELAEQAHAAVGTGEGWTGAAGAAGHLYATTGHAAATLARRTGSEPVRADALQRLTRALTELDPAAQARAAALCAAQLATLHLEAGDVQDGARWARRALETGGGIRSVRLAEHLATIRGVAAGLSDATGMPELVADLDTALTHHR